MTDEQQALADRHRQLTEAALRLGEFLTTDPTERAAVLLAVAATIIEREVGRVLANDALAALLEPTIMAWLEPEAGEARH